MKRRALLVSAGAAAAAAGAGLAWWQLAGRAQPHDGLWDARFETPEGEFLSLADYRGGPLLLNFWATWCAPCVREMPQVDRFFREFRARGWQVVGMAVDNAPQVREFLARRVQVSFPVAIAGYAGVTWSRSLGNAQGGLPFTVAFGVDGDVAHRKLGETHYDELAGWARGS
ncbi:TlpA family protein disulfide reductase [Caldimonas brevitalea]|uniref:Redoxin n=1 Tax=Caldimonas brevitalea TaxID=413882 RepID=A0A0G3BEJ5_9BURK|nr:TlpA disulfide reductase family protein [Caldimonas brevitalea]AKJ27752.1 redoxin [Caldimonas brevitalea]